MKPNYGFIQHLMKRRELVLGFIEFVIKETFISNALFNICKVNIA